MSTQMVPKYTAPTKDEIFQALAESSIRPTLYRAGIDWFSWSYLGERLWIAPHLQSEPMVEAPYGHPGYGTTERYKANGLYPVKARIGSVWADLPNKGRHDTGARGVESGWSVEDQASFALLKHTEHGVVLLTGDEQHDTRARAFSKKLVYTAKHAWADAQRKTRAEDVQRFRQNPLNANLPDPPPTGIQRQAQDWLDQFASAETSQRFKCKFGCSDWSDRELYVRHMQVQHGLTPEADEKPVEVEAVAMLAEIEKASESLASREAELVARETSIKAMEKNLQDQIAKLQERFDASESMDAGRKEKGKGGAKS